jgi:hypothetical protein
MVAVPFRAELRAHLLYRCAGVLATFAVALAMIAVAGRIDELNLHWIDAIWIPGAVLVAAAVYSLLGQRLGEQLARMQPLDADARRAEPPPVRWAWMPLKALGAGLVLGGIALVLDLEADGLAIVLAVALGSSLGGLGAHAVRVAGHERAHDRAVYRVEDPPGTDAGLAWLPRGGQ